MMKFSEIVDGWFPHQTGPAHPETEDEKGQRLRANAAKIRWHVWGLYPTVQEREAAVRQILGEEDYDRYVRDFVPTHRARYGQQRPPHLAGGAGGLRARDE